tara:strand:+ start:2084 stop:4630 length:2547 start_codon:yes stop_codon:yes gene_type:complete
VTEPTPVQERDILTETDATARAERISNCRYELALDLIKGAPTYKGTVTIAFDQSGEGDLTLNFRGKRIDSLQLNGETVDFEWIGKKLTLAGKLLLSSNSLRIEYENDYDHGGDGFHQFVDPEDGEEYLYTNFEPFDAHRLFPCFDQPDIKASYQLTVTAPAEWTLTANASEASAETQADSRIQRQYAETPPFSTYLFALIAGPYHVARDQHEGIPLGLLCRRSMAQYLDTDELFTITRQGLDFFGEFFDYKYAFGKYDQIFVPEFNHGAMENVGAVTFNESMVYRDPPTENQRRRRAEVILHEMAHMWFGNLVTMRWWNDLWLNESFATYMSYLAMEAATRFQSGWQDFNNGIKNWAYRQDQLVTTHPIAGTVRDTDETFLNFDGITYGKGASVLKQLVATIGIEGFREGMRHYFRTYDYGNASLHDFLGALETGSGRKLEEWSRLWLETASLNTIRAEWVSDSEHLIQLDLSQTAPADYPTIRPHTLETGLLSDDGTKTLIEAIPAVLEGERTSVEGVQGKARPALVYPNFNDHAYAKIALDDQSVAWARENIERVEDDLLRQQLWSTLWSMVRDQQLKSTDFLAIVRNKIRFEQNIELVDSVLGHAASSHGRYVPANQRDSEAHELFETARKGLLGAPDEDTRIIWGRALVGFAVNPNDLLYLGQLADGDEVISGFELDQDMRWGISARYTAFGLPGAAERVSAEAKRDPSDRGQRAQLRCETSVPDPKIKAAAWERFTGEGYGSRYLNQAAMSGFNWTHQEELLNPYIEAFFEQVPEVFTERDREFATVFYGGLFPGYRVEKDTLERAQSLLDATSEEQAVLQRMLRESIDDLGRAISCRAFADS